MDKVQVGAVDHGLYVIHWKKEHGGGTSLASVGSDAGGRRWFAATNWIEVPSFDWSAVDWLEPVGSLLERYKSAAEEIVCMQHMHEGRGGCHGSCPICCASVALGMDKYLRKDGDKERVAELQKLHGYPELSRG